MFGEQREMFRLLLKVIGVVNMEGVGEVDR
jgi:hypothetical protein